MRAAPTSTLPDLWYSQKARMPMGASSAPSDVPCAPPQFGSSRAAPKFRTPLELVRHMDSVLGYARTRFIGGSYRPPELTDFQATVVHFHEVLADLGRHLVDGSEFHGITAEQLLQGPFSDAMTHAGQLAMLRRLAGSPLPPANFIFSAVSANNLV